MAEINRVNDWVRATRLEYLAPDYSPTRPSGRLRAVEGTAVADPPAADLELSDIGSVLSRLSATPGIRVGKVAKIRAAIAAGTYESADKVNTVVERLLHELTR